MKQFTLDYLLKKWMTILVCIILGINEMSAQTIEDMFDLNFQSLLNLDQSNLSPWQHSSWMSIFSADSTQTIDNRFPLKIVCAKNDKILFLYQRKGSIKFDTIPPEPFEKNISFTLAQTIFLPTLDKRSICTISLNCKTELDSLQLLISAFDENGNHTYSESLLINRNDKWTDYPITFPLKEAKSIKIMINHSYSGYSKQVNKKKILLNQIKISIDDQLINHYPISFVSE